jgi:DNA processing protein
MIKTCHSCLARAWLLVRLGGHLEAARGRIDEVLALNDDDLIAAVGGRQRGQIEDEIDRLDTEALRAGLPAGVDVICRCSRLYPEALLDLDSAPAVLHVVGGIDRLGALLAERPVAIVGARRASPYGLDVARSLGRSLALSGQTVVSGMALGIDSAAHAGALEAGAPTLAVLPGPADRPYPARKAGLHRQIVSRGAAVSEMPAGAPVWRWTFRARNRIIAALAATTVVVEAGERSGSLLTARFADELGRPVGAVPGRITSPVSAGTNNLLVRTAYVVRGPQDVLDHLFGYGRRVAVTDEPRAPIAPELRRLLRALGDGHDTAAALRHAGMPAQDGLAALAELELGGYVRRGAGGRFHVVP